MAVSPPATGSTIMARLSLQTLRKRTNHRSFRLVTSDLPNPVLFAGDTVFPIDRSEPVPALLTAIDGEPSTLPSYLTTSHLGSRHIEPPANLSHPPLGGFCKSLREPL